MQLLVNIDVANLEQAIAFYEAALPLRLSRRLFDGQAAELLGASSRLYLLERAEDTAATPAADADADADTNRCVRSYQRHWTPVHLDFVVDDVDAAAQQALNAGAKQELQTETFPWGRLAAFSDPFGNGFCLVQFAGPTFYPGA